MTPSFAAVAATRLGVGLIYGIVNVILPIRLLIWDLALCTTDRVVPEGRARVGSGHGSSSERHGQPELLPDAECHGEPRASARPGIIPRNGCNITFPGLNTKCREMFNFSPTFCFFLTRGFHNPDQPKPTPHLRIKELFESGTGPGRDIAASNLLRMLGKQHVQSKASNGQYSEEMVHKLFGASNSTLLTICGGRVTVSLPPRGAHTGRVAAAYRGPRWSHHDDVPIKQEVEDALRPLRVGSIHEYAKRKCRIPHGTWHGISDEQLVDLRSVTRIHSASTYLQGRSMIEVRDGYPRQQLQLAIQIERTSKNTARVRGMDRTVAMAWKALVAAVTVRLGNSSSQGASAKMSDLQPAVGCLLSIMTPNPD
ncbi:uncharacterized protein B0H18DRAFT_962918 [Fomitopsis serialis]|uniref:uncharacterized protein n=1 Tax=Fomitopsis serialis TaxID=139415 RepID=UPI0020087DAD|nr:uncharacterized protein B0H18DRAFT_962918 [Neoantrodia serialis]KAH9910738.1 hypothetical protein B0H18DRAFT_962918 [Neoantrodia serialis]